MCWRFALAGSVAGAFAIVAWRPAIAPIAPPAANSFDPALVKRGAELAAIGDCDVCHTAPGGRAFAGGRGVPTPFGSIYSTNITPILRPESALNGRKPRFSERYVWACVATVRIFIRLFPSTTSLLSQTATMMPFMRI